MEGFFAASDNYKDFMKTFGMRKQDSIVRKLAESPNSAHAVTDLIGAGKSTIGKNVDTWLNELKLLGPEAYETGQAALVKRVESILSPGSGDFNYDKFIKAYETLEVTKLGEGSALNNHMPAEVLQNLREVKELAEARRLAKIHFSEKNSMGYLKGIESFAAGLNDNSSEAGTAALSWKVAAARLALKMIGKGKVLGARKNAIGDATVDLKHESAEARLKDAKTQLEAARKRLERKIRVKGRDEALSSPRKPVKPTDEALQG
jgi:hypothetical protein